MTMFRRIGAFVLTTAAVLAILGGYFAHRATTPVTTASKTVDLSDKEKAFFDGIQNSSPALLDDKAQTLERVYALCSQIDLPDAEWKDLAVPALSTSQFKESRPGVLILRVHLRPLCLNR